MSDANGHSTELDRGADRETRDRPCIKRTWCVLAADHEHSCIEAPRSVHEPADFGPNRKAKR